MVDLNEFSNISCREYNGTNPKVSTGYRAFTVDEDGVVIVSYDPDITDSLYKNNEFSIYRRLGRLNVFNSRDKNKYLLREGLPLAVMQYISHLFGKFGSF